MGNFNIDYSKKADKSLDADTLNKQWAKEFNENMKDPDFAESFEAEVAEGVYGEGSLEEINKATHSRYDDIIKRAQEYEAHNDSEESPDF